MLLNNRIIWKDNATLRDISINMSDFYAGTETMPIVAAEDAIYIGSDMPFNHRFFDLGASGANAVASNVSVSIWDGNSFNAAVDVLDLTRSSAGATLSKSGIISWVTDRNKSWEREDTTENISDLSTLKIYQMYWVKLTFSSDLTSTTALNYIGHKFSEDTHLASFYADLDNTALKTAIKAGKADYEDQEIAAAEVIVSDLRQKRDLWSVNQILDWERFQQPSVHKTAEIIYSLLGQDFEEDRLRARQYYKEELSKSKSNGGIDLDADGRLDVREKFTVAGIKRR